MRVDLNGRSALVIGAETPVTRAVTAALTANGAQTSRRGLSEADPTSPPPDILVIGHGLKADAPAPEHQALIAATDHIGEAMAARGAGRVIVLTTALGLLPARRHAGQSLAAAAVVAAMRGLAM